MAHIRRHGALLSLATLVACGGAAGRIATTPTPSPARHAVSTPTATVAPTPTPYPTDGVAANRLWLMQSGSPATVQVADLTRGTALASMQAGAVAPDWTRMYSVSTAMPGTPVLQVLDPRSGTLLQRVALEAGMDVPQAVGFGGRDDGLSPSGRRLVLTGGPRDSITGDLTHTEFRVYDTAHVAAPPRRVSLDGSWSYVAVDDAGRNLYLLQHHVNPDSPDNAALRRFDLVRAALDPNPVPVAGAAGDGITGIAVNTQVVDGGTWQLSVYAFGREGPYLLALDVVHGTARRIALPGQPSPNGVENEEDLLWSLVPSHDGRHVVAVNPATGALVELGAAPPFTARVATIPVPPTPVADGSGDLGGVLTAEAKRLLIGGAASSPDDRTLYAIGEEGVAVIDTATLTLRTTLIPGTPFQSLALSGDGRWLYLVSAERQPAVLQVDTEANRIVAIPAFAGASGVLRVTPAG